MRIYVVGLAFSISRAYPVGGVSYNHSTCSDTNKPLQTIWIERIADRRALVVTVFGIVPPHIGP